MTSASGHVAKDEVGRNGQFRQREEVAADDHIIHCQSSFLDIVCCNNSH